jgi:magnesium-transporting ATPase (P-type)
LLVAYRQLPLNTFETWYERYQHAASSLENRDEAVSDVATEIEVDLMLAGLTAVEDKLQDGVPETISTLRCAGIKIWLLTGDKQATALSTAQAAALVTMAPSMQQSSAAGTNADDPSLLLPLPTQVSVVDQPSFSYKCVHTVAGHDRTTDNSEDCGCSNVRATRPTNAHDLLQLAVDRNRSRTTYGADERSRLRRSTDGLCLLSC